MGRSAVIIKSNPYGLILNLDPELTFDELREAVADKFKKSAGFFKMLRWRLPFGAGSSRKNRNCSFWRL